MNKQELSDAARAFAARYQDCHTIHVEAKRWTVEDGHGYMKVVDVAEFRSADWGDQLPVAVSTWALFAGSEELYLQAMQLSGERHGADEGYLTVASESH